MSEALGVLASSVKRLSPMPEAASSRSDQCGQIYCNLSFSNIAHSSFNIKLPLVCVYWILKHRKLSLQLMSPSCHLWQKLYCQRWHKLLKLFNTILISPASAERSFSSLWRLKSHLRSHYDPKKYSLRLADGSELFKRPSPNPWKGAHFVFSLLQTGPHKKYMKVQTHG